MPPHASRCDFEGCAEWATYGFTAPYGHPKPKRPLWACLRHRDWAEARWRTKYHTGPDRPRNNDVQPGSHSSRSVSGDTPDARQSDLFGGGA